METSYNEYIAGLVYLFVDGEATETEKETLFTALPENTWLQKELQSAIIMLNTAKSEYSETQLPLTVETGLFAKAGFASNPTGLDVKAGEKSKIGGGGIFNKLFIPLLSGFFGALLTYLLFWWNSPAGDEPAIMPKVLGHFAGLEMILPSVQGLPSDNTRQSTDNKKQVYLHINHPVLSDTQVKDEKVAGNTKETIMENPEERVNKLPGNMSGFQGSRSINLILPDYSAAKPTQSFREFIIDNPDFNQAGYNLWEHLSIQISGFSVIELFPSRTADQSKIPDVNNLAVDLRYNFDEDFYAGITAGIETFPIYIENGKNELVYNSSIKWYGLKGGYSGFCILDESLKPYFNLMCGYTVSGPIFKAGTGLSWKPDATTRFTLGCEGTSLVYIFDKIWKSGEKISLVYGVEIVF